MSGPFIENALGIQHDVQAFIEEQLDQLGRFPGIWLPFIGRVGGLQGTLVHLLKASQVVFGAFKVCLRVIPELGQATGQELLGIGNQFQYITVCPFVLGAGFLNKAFQRCDNRGDGRNAGCVGAALEGMQGPGEVIGIADRGLVAGSCQEVVDGLQVGFGFVFENFQQDRINGVFIAVVGFLGANGFRLSQ